ncbi:hypothetical protein BDV95DRAFT_609935 [Massariosphaeria phaeospora]|uniref:Uncharacterized protein n=1 Tax=Massariosphaeria phaeospora TaxID=100035 RepID=A0A7C8I1M3_9PLEO|nr:hypothetical protein BDV95DRAFT_609935 [Massariosphaeria phaeospora]
MVDAKPEVCETQRTDHNTEQEKTQAEGMTHDIDGDTTMGGSESKQVSDTAVILYRPALEIENKPPVIPRSTQSFGQQPTAVMNQLSEGTAQFSSGWHGISETPAQPVISSKDVHMSESKDPSGDEIIEVVYPRNHPAIAFTITIITTGALPQNVSELQAVLHPQIRPVLKQIDNKIRSYPLLKHLGLHDEKFLEDATAEFICIYFTKGSELQIDSAALDTARDMLRKWTKADLVLYLLGWLRIANSVICKHHKNELRPKAVEGLDQEQVTMKIRTSALRNLFYAITAASLRAGLSKVSRENCTTLFQPGDMKVLEADALPSYKFMVNLAINLEAIQATRATSLAENNLHRYQAGMRETASGFKKNPTGIPRDELEDRRKQRDEEFTQNRVMGDGGTDNLALLWNRHVHAERISSVQPWIVTSDYGIPESVRKDAVENLVVLLHLAHRSWEERTGTTLFDNSQIDQVAQLEELQCMRALHAMDGVTDTSSINAELYEDNMTDLRKEYREWADENLKCHARSMLNRQDLVLMRNGALVALAPYHPIEISSYETIWDNRNWVVAEKEDKEKGSHEPMDDEPDPVQEDKRRRTSSVKWPYLDEEPKWAFSDNQDDGDDLAMTG